MWTMISTEIPGDGPDLAHFPGAHRSRQDDGVSAEVPEERDVGDRLGPAANARSQPQVPELPPQRCQDSDVVHDDVPLESPDPGGPGCAQRVARVPRASGSYSERPEGSGRRKRPRAAPPRARPMRAPFGPRRGSSPRGPRRQHPPPRRARPGRPPEFRRVPGGPTSPSPRPKYYVPSTIHRVE